MRLLLTHGDESNARLSDNLAEHGIDCVAPDLTRRVYGLEETFEVDAGLVYPGRLIEGGVVDALSGVNWVNGLDAVTTSRNKARCVALLDDAGVPVPETRLVSNPVDDSDVVEAFGSIDGDVVIKPNSATRGNGVVRVTDSDSAVGVSDYLGVIHDSSLVFDRTFLVQEFVADARDYRVMVVGGDYVGAVERRGGGWKHNVHRGAEAVGVEPPEGVVSIAEDAARTLGIDFCGVDVLDGARRVVNEVNARPTVDNSEKYEPEFYDVLARVVEGTK